MDTYFHHAPTLRGVWQTLLPLLPRAIPYGTGNATWQILPCIV